MSSDPDTAPLPPGPPLCSASSSPLVERPSPEVLGPAPAPASTPTTTTTGNPLKRKTPPTEDGCDDAEAEAEADVDVDPDADADAEAEVEERSFTPASGEYESGRVSCDTCGLSVSFRDETTGGFTLKEWQEHKETCCGGAPMNNGDGAPQNSSKDGAQVPPSPMLNTISSATHPPAKRRRAKRTEEERKAYLGSDPYVERFEAYRVLCKSCDKWIRLRPNSTYCSIPWDAHRKSCLAKKINSKNVYALEERNALFSKDPDVRKFDAERVLCNICDNWLPLNSDNHLVAVQTWLQHRAACQQSRPGTASGTAAPIAGGSPPPTKAGSSTSPKAEPADGQPPLSIPASPNCKNISNNSNCPHPTPSSPSFHDLNPANYAPAHESRRRNAEQRAATLRADTLIAEVEPNRVFCSLCQKWVQLRQDSSYCAYPWLQHRGKCLARHQRRAAKAAEVAEAKARKLGHVPSHPPISHPPPSHHHPAHPSHSPTLSAPPPRTHPNPRPLRSLSADLESEDESRAEGAEEVYRRQRERERERERDRERERERARFHGSYKDKPRSYDHRHAPYPHPNGHHSHPHGHAHPHGHGHGHGHPHAGHAYRPSTGSSTASARVIRAWNADVPPGHPDAGEASGDVDPDVDADVDVDADAEGEVELDADGERDPEMSPPPPPPPHRESRPSSSSHRPSSSSAHPHSSAAAALHHREREREREPASYSHSHVHPHAHPHSHPHAHGHSHHRRPSFALSTPPTHPTPIPPTHLDLDSSNGRRHFVFSSIAHLRGTTYEASDEMNVSALVAYLNAAVPVDKYEDFDTAEVVKLLGNLRERGRVRLEGDLVWLA